MALSRMAGDTSAKAAPLTGASAGIPGSDAVSCVPPGSNRAVKLNQVPLPCMASALFLSCGFGGVFARKSVPDIFTTDEPARAGRRNGLEMIL